MIDLKELQREAYIFTKSAAARITGREIKSLRVWKNCVFVKFEEGSPKFISKEVFIGHFYQWRQESAKRIGIDYDISTGKFKAYSASFKNVTYELDLFPNHIQCTCGDYHQQERFEFNKPRCKHVYAVLDYLGYDCISDYVLDNGIKFLDRKPSKLPVEMSF